MESLLYSPASQWNEFTSQKNMDTCSTTPSIMATALTKSNPWYRSCFPMLIQLPITEILQTIENRPVSVIPSIHVRSLCLE